MKVFKNQEGLKLSEKCKEDLTTVKVPCIGHQTRCPHSSQLNVLCGRRVSIIEVSN
jgi:hypothetical protein